MSNSCVVLPGVYVLERGWLSANNILFADGVTAVVDTGYWTHQAQTVSLVSALLRDQGLSLILNTHLHSDHCGGNTALAKQFPDVQILIPPGQSQYVQAWDSYALSYEPTGQYCPPFAFNGILRPGTELQLGRHNWQVHCAPGHDPHSIVLFEPLHRILISADALWENGFGVVFPELEGGHAFADVAATLDLIEHLRPLVVIPGHGRVFSNLSAALERARRRLDGFIENPHKHSHHAAKVLLKFKLLEEQRMTLTALEQWACATPYFQQVHVLHFSEVSCSKWIEQLVEDLVRVNAAVRIDQDVVNI